MHRPSSFSVALLFQGLLLPAAATPLSNQQQPVGVPGSHFGLPARNATYDYVVVGGGTGGLAIASRLAENGKFSVAVIEAGGFYEVENGNTSVVPAYNQDYNYITPDSQWDAPLVDWGFLTSPQAGAMGQRFHYGRGKMLGGCSAENAMNYNRPTKGSLEQWASAVNGSSYAWDNFLPYFEQSVTYTNPNTTIRAPNATVPGMPAAHLTHGPLQISFPNWATPIASWARLAFRELGIPDIHDLISGSLIGSQYDPLTLNPRDQTRSSSQTSFLKAAFDSRRDNIKVYTHTLARKIMFSNNKTATGVEVRSGPSPQSFFISARKEVILSAGAFQSPQLLMVSGVGPADQLSQHNISVLADLPGVGQNMWDHVVLSVGRQVSVETIGRLMNSTLNAQAVKDYSASPRTGILTNDQSDYLGWEKLPRSTSNLTSSAVSDLSNFASDWPEIEYEISSAPFGTPSFSTPSNPIDVGYIQPILIAPLSRGNITLNSSSMSDPPIINPNWLTHPTDQIVSIAAFKRAREFFNTSAIAPILIGEELYPGPQTLPFNALDSEILSYIQESLGFNWHASCTCKMGTSQDPLAVVDSQARVFGVKHLRVVDASAFALLPPGHPQATVYALAEKIAADILSGGNSTAVSD